jgi:hypothetical protein
MEYMVVSDTLLWRDFLRTNSFVLATLTIEFGPEKGRRLVTR